MSIAGIRVVHAIPGRVRVKIAQLRDSPELAMDLHHRLSGVRGIQRVELSSDNGETWHETRFDYPGTALTWTFWSFDWTPEEPGKYTLVSRATDGTGAPQPSETRSIVPQGATGYHRVVATVE